MNSRQQEQIGHPTSLSGKLMVVLALWALFASAVPSFASLCALDNSRCTPLYAAQMQPRLSATVPHVHGAGLPLLCECCHSQGMSSESAALACHEMPLSSAATSRRIADTTSALCCGNAPLSVLTPSASDALLRRSVALEVPSLEVTSIAPPTVVPPLFLVRQWHHEPLRLRSIHAPPFASGRAPPVVAFRA